MQEVRPFTADDSGMRHWNAGMKPCQEPARRRMICADQYAPLLRGEPAMATSSDHHRRGHALSRAFFSTVTTFLTIVALITGLLSACTTPPPPVPPATTSASSSAPVTSCETPPTAQLVVPCGYLWGIYPRTTAAGARTTDFIGNTEDLERAVGRKFDILTRYHGWNEIVPDAVDIELSRDHILLVDLRARDFQTGGYARWADIAAGRYDAYLERTAEGLHRLGRPVFFSFNQEPEQELERGTGVAGTAADYRAAWRHVHDVLQGPGIVFVWWVMGTPVHNDWYRDLYPGDDVVDWISWDPYNFNTCNDSVWRDPYDAFSRWYRWIETAPFGQDKPLMLSEYAAHGTAVGSWYAGVPAALALLPRIKAVVQFDSTTERCELRVTASADNLAGFRAAGLRAAQARGRAG
ncbi:glycoside hydrolase family 26 protein [Jatrophihabitans sp. YIM 134969]